MMLSLPEMSLVLLIGPSSSGKSTFARQHFLPTEVISSDYCRALVSDDENDMACTDDAFDLLHYMVDKRLSRGKLTVVDATNVQPHARKPLLELAKKHHFFAVALVFDLPEKVLLERHNLRTDRSFGEYVIRNHQKDLRRSQKYLKDERYFKIYPLKSPEEVESAQIERAPLWNNRKDLTGPFDLIGDVHGCMDELLELMQLLGYEATPRMDEDRERYVVTHPQGRKIVFVGDLVDRGPNTPEVLRLVMDVVASGAGLCVCGNHDNKLYRKLSGKQVQLKHGLEQSLAQLEAYPEAFVQEVKAFLGSLISHYVLDGGNLVVAHAGIKEQMQGRGSAAVREFCMYGDTTGEIDEFGLPVRLNWAMDYRGKALVVYGHTPVPEPIWENNTVNLDTGCVFGGRLTALRYPERETLSVPALMTYAESRKPFLPEDLSSQEPPTSKEGEMLEINDFLGRNIVSTQLAGAITIHPDQAAAAMETMSRFAVNPHWLIYLPPTMSPSETSKLPGLLEHPAEAFAYYRQAGLESVICEEKHMGSRLVVVLCRDASVAASRFGIADGSIGSAYTRTGRPFFNKPELETAFLQRLQAAVTQAGLWESLETEWLCLDAELLPWSAKALELIRHQYAAVATAAQTGLTAANSALAQAAARGLPVTELQNHFQHREEMVQQYNTVYQHYCWQVNSLDDYQIAPFHLLAAEGRTFFNQTHLWHMEQLSALQEADPAWIKATPFRVVSLQDETSVQEAIQWWEALTAAGGEGMVVKPLDYVARNRKGEVLQPAVKCRGREYLRIIYGPEYTAPEHLSRLRSRGLNKKRSNALREFALGAEALERFVKRHALSQVHQCVFGVLALESDPIDPRL